MPFTIAPSVIVTVPHVPPSPLPIPQGAYSPFVNVITVLSPDMVILPQLLYSALPMQALYQLGFPILMVPPYQPFQFCIIASVRNIEHIPIGDEAESVDRIGGSGLPGRPSRKRGQQRREHGRHEFPCRFHIILLCLSYTRKKRHRALRDAAVIYCMRRGFLPPPIQCEPVEYQFCHTARRTRIIIDISAARLLATGLHQIKFIFASEMGDRRLISIACALAFAMVLLHSAIPHSHHCTVRENHIHHHYS